MAGAVFDPAGAGAREAMLPEAAESAGLSLPRANGIHEAIWGAAFLLGPGLGGLDDGRCAIRRLGSRRDWSMMISPNAPLTPPISSCVRNRS